MTKRKGKMVSEEKENSVNGKMDSERGSLESSRKIAGIMSMAVGIPNFLVAVVLMFGGLVLTIILGIAAYRLSTEGGGDSVFAPLIVALVLVIIIVLIIFLVIMTVLSIIFAFFMGGQTIGGWLAFRGKWFGASVTLIILGSVASLLWGFGLLIIMASGDISAGARLGALLWGIFSVLSFVVSVVSVFLIVRARKTFTKKKKGKKKRNKNR